MTKAKARERAKAKAGQKIKKKETSAGQPERDLRPGQFGPRDSAVSRPGGGAAGKGASGARRGAARSR